MNIVVTILVLFIAFEHIGFFVLESFFWDKPLGRKIFRQSEAMASTTKVLAFNQGFYNLFLAAGLLWSLWHPEALFAFQLKVFFLLCVFVAGLIGAISANKRILWIQGLPALLALVLVFFTNV